MKVKDEDRLLRCILLLGTFDAPAKCLFQEFCHFNAFHGWPYCLSLGKTVQTSSKGILMPNLLMTKILKVVMGNQGIFSQ